MNYYNISKENMSRVGSNVLSRLNNEATMEQATSAQQSKRKSGEQSSKKAKGKQQIEKRSEAVLPRPGSPDLIIDRTEVSGVESNVQDCDQSIQPLPHKSDSGKCSKPRCDVDVFKSGVRYGEALLIMQELNLLVAVGIPPELLQKCAEVVYIWEMNQSRCIAGTLKPLGGGRPPKTNPAPSEASGSGSAQLEQMVSDVSDLQLSQSHDSKQAQASPSGCALFSPMDSRLPRLLVPLAQCPPDFLLYPLNPIYERTLFAAKIEDWKLDCPFANGSLLRCIGEKGTVESETSASLLCLGIDWDEDFSQEVLDCVEHFSTDTWEIPVEELARRKDFRDDCIFTIDPATARDLDDALHCKRISQDEFEVGVHIADVSYFLHEDTALDNEARRRTTSVYLAHKVIPMLPRVLCERLCSLHPGVDRLTLSVVWRMDLEGHVTSQWMGRSVIRSAAKLSYEQAQRMIDFPEDEDDTVPLTPDGMSVTEKIKPAVLHLHEISKKLRERRFDHGCLKIQKINMGFGLDANTKMPNSFQIRRNQASNELIEEFMLLANISVAHELYHHFPSQAMLRRHEAPSEHLMLDLQKLCQSLNLPIEVGTSKSLADSLGRLHAEASRGGMEAKGKYLVAMELIAKPMHLALYFCTGCLSEENYRHYALSVPLYTHFTSPIRRYPDVIVHRLLAFSLGQGEEQGLDSSSMQMLADRCNTHKHAAKKASDASVELFFTLLVRECGPFMLDGVICGVLNKSLDIVLLESGLIKRLYLEQQLLVTRFELLEGAIPQQNKLHVTFKGCQHPVPLAIFQPIRVSVSCSKTNLKLTLDLLADSLPGDSM